MDRRAWKPKNFYVVGGYLELISNLNGPRPISRNVNAHKTAILLIIKQP